MCDIVLHFERKVCCGTGPCGQLARDATCLWQCPGMIKRGMHRVAQVLQNEDGDVPGWVLITLMTAGLVIVIWGLAGPALANVFQQAIARVTGF
jgi:hypothetical protein